MSTPRNALSLLGRRSLVAFALCACGGTEPRAREMAATPPQVATARPTAPVATAPLPTKLRLYGTRLVDIEHRRVHRTFGAGSEDEGALGAFEGDTAYLVQLKNRAPELRAYDVASGAIRWTVPFTQDPRSKRFDDCGWITAVRDGVYCTLQENHLLVFFDRKTGERKLEKQVENIQELRTFGHGAIGIGVESTMCGNGAGCEFGGGFAYLLNAAGAVVRRVPLGFSWLGPSPRLAAVADPPGALCKGAVQGGSIFSKCLSPKLSDGREPSLPSLLEKVEGAAFRMREQHGAYVLLTSDKPKPMTKLLDLSRAKVSDLPGKRQGLVLDERGELDALLGERELFEPSGAVRCTLELTRADKRRGIRVGPRIYLASWSRSEGATLDAIDSTSCKQVWEPRPPRTTTRRASTFSSNSVTLDLSFEGALVLRTGDGVESTFEIYEADKGTLSLRLDRGHAD